MLHAKPSTPNSEREQEIPWYHPAPMMALPSKTGTKAHGPHPNIRRAPLSHPPSTHPKIPPLLDLLPLHPPNRSSPLYHLPPPEPTPLNLVPIPVPLRSEHPRTPLHPAPVPSPPPASPLASLPHVLVPVTNARKGLFGSRRTGRRGGVFFGGRLVPREWDVSQAMGLRGVSCLRGL